MRAWALCACALLGGRAFGLTGIAGFALGWPLSRWWDDSAPGGWEWGALLAAVLGTASAASLRALLAVGLAGAALLLWRSRRRPVGLWGWVPVLAAGGAAGLLARPGLPLPVAAGFALAQAGLVALALYPARSLLARSGASPAPKPGGPLSLLGAAAAAGVCAAGLAAGRAWPVDPRAVAVTVIALWLWPPDEGMAAAAAGAVSAWVAALPGGVGAVAPASLALGGALGWSFAGVRRWAAAAGLAGGAIVAAAAAGHGWAWSWGVAFPCGLWALLASDGRSDARPPSPAPDPAGAGIEVPAAWPDRLRAAARACLDLSRGLAQVAPAGAAPLHEEREGLRVAEEVCPGCPSLRACWERRLPQASLMVAELWQAAAAGGVTWQQVGGPDSLYCLRPREMAEVANRHAALARQREDLSRLLAASRRSAVAPLLTIGRVLGELADEAAVAVAPGERGPGAHEAPRLVQARWHAAASGPCWGYAAVAAARAKPGRTVSGDAFRCRLLPGERLALLLCDGMGSGPLAAIAASAAAEHALAWLAAGRAPADALRLANERLLEDGDAERFATIDLAVVHLRAALLECYKMGAPPSFLCHARGVRELPGGGLPAGILPHPEVRFSRARLRPGDTLALVSDGVLGRPVPGPQGGRAARWLADHLRAELENAPGAAGVDHQAVGMIEAAARRAQGDHDDLTALVSVLLGPGGSARGANGHAATAGADPARDP